MAFPNIPTWMAKGTFETLVHCGCSLFFLLLSTCISTLRLEQIHPQKHPKPRWSRYSLMRSQSTLAGVADMCQLCGYAAGTVQAWESWKHNTPVCFKGVPSSVNMRLIINTHYIMLYVILGIGYLTRNLFQFLSNIQISQIPKAWDKYFSPRLEG